MYDICIKNGFVVDGSGNPWFRADVGIKDDKIEKISESIHDEEEQIINAKDLVVSPGFIDTHAHSDILFLVDPYCETKVFQGITSEVSGQCGQSAAPLGKRWLGDAWLDDIKDRFSMHSWDKAKELVSRNYGIDLNWKTIGDYLTRLEDQGIAINYMQLIGLETLRAAAIGDIAPKPNDKELEEEKVLLKQSMEEGAWGLSDGGLHHEFDKNESLSLCKIVAEKKGIFMYHIRSYGDRLIEAIKEALEIAEKTNVLLNISHLVVSPRSNWGKVTTALKLIDEARARGSELYCDQLPYMITASNYYSPDVISLLPDWVLEGGTDQMFSRLRNTGTREKIKQQMKEGIANKWHTYAEWYPLRTSKSYVSMWDNMMTILSYEGAEDLEGKTVAEISRSRKADPYDVVLDIMAEDPSAKMAFFGVCEEDVIEVMKHPITMFGTDGGTLPATKRPGIPHPRIYGSFPRILGRYAREKGVLTLEEAVRKMTSLPAQALRLKNRGLIREGMYADITIFNPQRVIDKPSYTEYPKDFSYGIEYVIVNGKLVLEKGEHAKTLPGKILRHQ